MRKDGSRIDVSISTAALHDASGRAIGLVATYVDISGRKRAEEALRHSQEQLRQAQKMEAVGRLAGGVAHDFNNLLSAILSYSEMVLRRAARRPPQPRRCSSRSARPASAPPSSTRQLLAFSRRQVLRPAGARPQRRRGATSDRMLRRVIGEDIELRTVLDPALGLARGPIRGSSSRC